MRPNLVRSALFAGALLGVALPAGAQGYIELGGFGSAAKFDANLAAWRTGESAAKAVGETEHAA